MGWKPTNSQSSFFVKEKESSNVILRFYIQRRVHIVVVTKSFYSPKKKKLPRIFLSCFEVVGNSPSISRHSSCNSFTALLSMLGTGGTSPSDHVGSVLAAAMTAPSTNVSPPSDSLPAIQMLYWPFSYMLDVICNTCE